MIGIIVKTFQLKLDWARFKYFGLRHDVVNIFGP